MGRKTLIDMIGSAADNDVAGRLVTDITYAIETQDKENFRKPSQTISPSMLGCERRMIFKLMGTPPSNANKTAQLINICNYGTIRHQQIQETIHNMKSMGMKWEFVDVAQYVKENNLNLEIKKASDFDNGVYETHLFSPEYNISFLTDGILKFEDTYYILEIKTESPDKFLKQRDVQSEHRNQATAYAMLFNIKSVIFLYEDRSYCNMKAYMYTPNRLEKSTLKNSFINCNKMASERKVPARNFGIDKKVCTFCIYRTHCGENEDAFEEVRQDE